MIEGQSTASLEMHQYFQAKNIKVDHVLCPVGGGGLLGGTALGVKYFFKDCQVYGCEPANSGDAYQSFKTKKLIPSENPKTICDGLLTSLGTKNFEIIQNYVDGIIMAEEESIISVMKMIWECMKIIIEPSCAVPLAAIMEGKLDIRGKNIAIILSGGNVDLNHLPWILNQTKD